MPGSFERAILSPVLLFTYVSASPTFLVEITVSAIDPQKAGVTGVICLVARDAGGGLR
jgi:hypothetical protein